MADCSEIRCHNGDGYGDGNTGQSLILVTRGISETGRAYSGVDDTPKTRSDAVRRR